MLPHNTFDLLYIQTLEGSTIQTKCCFKTYDMILPFHIKKIVIYYLEQFNKSYTQQLKLAKRLLSINKLVPIYISKDIILFPIKHQRAPIQIYFNAQRIIGLTSSQNKTIITFDNSAQCVVDEPYILVYKKWQESILLAYLINKTTSFH